MPKTLESQLLGMLGLCRRAGKLVAGTELVSLAMAQKKPPALVAVCRGASDNTRKKIRTKSDYYGIPRMELPVSPEELGHAVGKSGGIAAVAVLDGHFAEALLRIESTGKDSSQGAEERG